VAFVFVGGRKAFQCLLSKRPRYLWGVEKSEYLSVVHSRYDCVNQILTIINETEMKHEWILDVLTDLRSFAKNNDLLTLAAQLEDTQLVAAIEIASYSESFGCDTTVQDTAHKRDFIADRSSKRVI
jgi:replicative DNA helicase